MQTSSAKAKGRRAAQEAKDLLLEAFSSLEEGDVVVTPAGLNGEDLRLSPKAQKFLPFAIEVKNQERINIWQALAQAEAHARGKNLTPLLIFKRNRQPLHVCLKLDSFLNLLMEREKHGA